MIRDRSNFRPKVGETYQLRGGGTGEVLRDDLTGTDRSLAVLVRQHNEVVIRVLSSNGKHPHLDECEYDLMPPQPEKKYRPWTVGELEYFTKHDGWVRGKTTDDLYRTGSVITDGETPIIRIEGVSVNAYLLLKAYTQDDEAKTPCGVEVPE